MTTRRDFLRHSACGLSAAAFLTTFRKLGEISAAALPGSDYRALVCVFLFGGNDGNNTIVPYDDYAAYQAVRGSTAALNLAKADLLPVPAPSQGGTFGLHPALADLAPLYGGGDLAVLCNVGTLVRPIVRAEYLAGAPRPDSLFSHFDQQSQWQTAAPDASSATGWGGRIADATVDRNAGASIPVVVSVAGATLFSTGAVSRPLVPVAALAGFGSPSRSAALATLLSLDGDLPLVAAQSGIVSAGISQIAALDAALAKAAAIATAFPQTDIGGQLEQIARIVAARSALGVGRQVFFASLGSFDTHTDQLATQQDLLGQLGAALKAFHDATVELGVADAVTTFTLSDFGRTFQAASGGGSDHAWGSHHFVMGGSIAGGDFFGRYPVLAVGGPDDASNEGRWIPTVSVEQYGATLAKWFGVPADRMTTVFPNLGAFDTADLGFLR